MSVATTLQVVASEGLYVTYIHVELITNPPVYIVVPVLPYTLV